jgi:hypothetical protein
MGGATKAYGTVFTTTYNFTAWNGSMYVTGTATFDVWDCLLMDTTGVATTDDYAVTNWGMGV